MLHRSEKRLAVLEAIIEQGMSMREARSTHGVATGSIESWLRRHHSGEETMESMRERGVVPTPPRGTPAMAHGPLRGAPRAMSDPLMEAKDLREQRERLRKQLTKERVVVAARLTAIDDALAALG